MNPIEDMSKIRLVICAFLSLAFSKDVKANPMFWGPARNQYYPSRYQNVEKEIKPVRCFGLDISSPIYGYSKYGGTPIIIDKTEYVIMRQADILAIYGE